MPLYNTRAPYYCTDPPPPCVQGAVTMGDHAEGYTVPCTPSPLGGRIGHRADAVRIVGTVTVQFESGRLQERLKQLRWRKWLFRGSVLYQID